MPTIWWDPCATLGGKHPSFAPCFHDEQPPGQREELPAGVTVLWRPILDRTPLEGKCQYWRIALVETAQFFRRCSHKGKLSRKDREHALEELGNLLEESRLVREDTFVKSVNTDVEREWLRKNRSEEAKHWNLLTNWRPEHLQYVL